MEWLDALYAAVEDDGIDLADAIAAACGTRSAMIDHHGPHDAIRSMNYWPADDFARYFREFRNADPWGEAVGGRLFEARPIAVDAILSPAAMMRSTMFNELMRPLGDDTARCLTIGARDADGSLLVAVHRAATDRPFAAADGRRIAEVHRHLGRVLRLRGLRRGADATVRRLAAMIAGSEAMLLVVAADLRVLDASPAAAACLDGADGLSLDRGRLDCRDAQTATLLRRWAAAIVRERAAAPVLLCPRPSGRAPYQIDMMPAGCGGGGGILVRVVDPARKRTSERARLAAAFGLTPMETALVDRLCDGDRLTDIADRRGVSRHTIRTQLKAVFLKCDANTQSDIVRIFR